MRQETGIQAAEGEPGSHPQEWVIDIEVSHEENRDGELVKVVFDLSRNEGCARRKIERAHHVASAKPHVHGNCMEGGPCRGVQDKGTVDRVIEQDTCTTMAMGALNLQN